MLVELGRVSVETLGNSPGDVEEPQIGSKIERWAMAYL